MDVEEFKQKYKEIIGKSINAHSEGDNNDNE